MCRSLSIIIKENCKMVFRQGVYLAVIFLFLVPHLYGIPNLTSEKAADCLGKLVVLIGIPMFVSILKPEHDIDIREIILIKRFPYSVTILFRIILAVLLSIVLICFFAWYMLYQGCEFPIGLYTVRTAVICMMIGGTGLLGSALFRKNLAGFLISAGFVMLFYDNFAAMIFGGIQSWVVAVEVLSYSNIFLLAAFRQAGS